MTNGNESNNPLEEIARQERIRKTNALLKLNEALEYVSSHRPDYCKHLKVTKNSSSFFETKGFRCGQEAPGINYGMLPEDVNRQCCKDCHQCEWYEPYQEPVPDPPRPVDRLSEAMRTECQIKRLSHSQKKELVEKGGVLMPNKIKLTVEQYNLLQEYANTSEPSPELLERIKKDKDVSKAVDLLSRSWPVSVSLRVYNGVVEQTADFIVD